MSLVVTLEHFSALGLLRFGAGWVSAAGAVL